MTSISQEIVAKACNVLKQHHEGLDNICKFHGGISPEELVSRVIAELEAVVAQDSAYEYAQTMGLCVVRMADKVYCAVCPSVLYCCSEGSNSSEFPVLEVEEQCYNYSFALNAGLRKMLKGTGLTRDMVMDEVKQLLKTRSDCEATLVGEHTVVFAYEDEDGNNVISVALRAECF